MICAIMKPLVALYKLQIKLVFSALLSGQQYIPRQKVQKSDGGMQVFIAYSFQKARSGPTNRKVNF